MTTTTPATGPAPTTGAGPDPRPLTPQILALFTPRRLRVLRLAAIGLHNKQIADALDIADQAVERHIAVILDALRVRNRTHAATVALKHGLLNPADIDTTTDEQPWILTRDSLIRITRATQGAQLHYEPRPGTGNPILTGLAIPALGPAAVARFGDTVIPGPGGQATIRTCRPPTEPKPAPAPPPPPARPQRKPAWVPILAAAHDDASLTDIGRRTGHTRAYVSSRLSEAYRHLGVYDHATDTRRHDAYQAAIRAGHINPP